LLFRVRRTAAIDSFNTAEMSASPVRTSAGKPIPLNSELANVLLGWKLESEHDEPEDWVFASPEVGGNQPYWPVKSVASLHPTRSESLWDQQADWLAYLSA
jgi:hypothetical protein